MSRYLIDGVALSKEHPMFQQALSTAYETKNRPTCMCKPDGVPMYIATLNPSEFLIKRMPNTATHHHIDCDSYEIPSELSGRGELDEKAVHEDQETGITSLKLDFSLSKMSTNRSPGPFSASGPSTTATVNPKRLSILSLLHFLIEEAGLNKWSHKMLGKRNWWIVRKYLLQAAANKVTRKNPILDVLLIPETFKLDQKDEITARRKALMSKLVPKAGKQPMGILVGELKNIEPARFGNKLVIKHMPETPLYMNDALFKRIQKLFDRELSFFYENESIHLIVIATFLLSASGNPTVDTISFQTLDRNWLPFEDNYDFELLERLVSADRHFIKGLRYNLKKKEVIASALLTDIAADPTAIYIAPAGEDNEQYIDEINAVIEASELNSLIWDPASGEPLKLPPANTH